MPQNNNTLVKTGRRSSVRSRLLIIQRIHKDKQILRIMKSSSIITNQLFNLTRTISKRTILDSGNIRWMSMLTNTPIVTPLVFLGGSFYSISMLPPVWQVISHFNPVVYLISGFRWAFFGSADVPIVTSLLAIAGFTALCLAVIGWIFRTGWRIRQ